MSPRRSGSDEMLLGVHSVWAEGIGRRFLCDRTVPMRLQGQRTEAAPVRRSRTLSSPEGSKPNSCYTPEPPETPSAQVSREPREQSVLIEGLSGSISLPFTSEPTGRPLDVLKKIFPAHKPPVLELILRGCGGDLVGAIEVLLSSRSPDGSAHPHADPHPDAALVLPSNGHLFEHALGSYHPCPPPPSGPWAPLSGCQTPSGSRPSPLRGGVHGPPGCTPSAPILSPTHALPAHAAELPDAQPGQPVRPQRRDSVDTVALQQQYQLRSAAQYVSPSVFRGSPILPSRPAEEPRISIQEENCALGAKPGLYSPDDEYEERSDSADSRILNSSA
uniref:Doublesex and mab-3 related transcription factor 3a n=1 Tax=Sphaeramia orbicularis TaxID=375764 RepID=A0A673BVK5_9TELE